MNGIFLLSVRISRVFTINSDSNNLVTPGGAKFLMVHDLVNDDGIRNFFVDVYEMWIR